VATPDPFLGENIKAFIVEAPDAQFDAKAAREHCLEKLGEFKTPSVFELIEELPKGPSGKILKRLLQERE
jgi:acyl-CoA synthetase (AMP-forming)/AMP-acid ligase II